jgi:23S rRNA (adenine2030-N6)-methyltransferase
MNYAHAFHAGNFADVVKHAVLARILMHLGEKPQPFRVIDTHAGAGLYDLAGPDASRTGEWRAGIGRLTGASLASPVHALLAPYLDAVAKFNPGGELRHYPGSPLIALSLLRPEDRLIACELEPGAAATLRTNLHADNRAKAIAIDGFTALNAYVPPKERRGLVLIDPPFEQANEFERLGQSLIDAHRKWSTGVYVGWYPRKDLPAVKRLINQIKRSGIPKVMRAEVDLGNDTTRLSGTGLLIINPPWRLDEELALLLPALADAMAQEQRPQLRIEAFASS